MTPPVVKMLTFDAPGEARDGSWVNVADLRCYIEWLMLRYAADAATLAKLDEAIVAGLVNRTER